MRLPGLVCIGIISERQDTRLSHAAWSGVLIVEMTRPAHEAPLTEMNRVLLPLVEQISYDSTRVCPSVEMNLSLQSSSGDFNATPDMAINLTRQSGEQLDPEILYIAECAFSQDEDALLKKLQLEVDAHPEIAMVTMITITESTQYRSPKELSTAWHTFCRFQECLTFKKFMAMSKKTDNDPQWLGPVMVGEHPWCRISNVDYYVWVKDGENKINVVKNCQPMTRGVSRFAYGRIVKI